MLQMVPVVDLSAPPGHTYPEHAVQLNSLQTLAHTLTTRPDEVKASQSSDLRTQACKESDDMILWCPEKQSAPMRTRADDFVTMLDVTIPQQSLSLGGNGGPGGSKEPYPNCAAEREAESNPATFKQETASTPEYGLLHPFQDSLLSGVNEQGSDQNTNQHSNSKISIGCDQENFHFTMQNFDTGLPERLAIPGSTCAEQQAKLIASGLETLVRACKLGKIIEIENALEQGFNVDSRHGITGNTLLHIAAANGHKKICKMLLRAKADINAVNYVGDTALHCALALNYRELGGYLYSKGADDSIPNHKGETCYETARSSSLAPDVGTMGPYSIQAPRELAAVSCDAEVGVAPAGPCGTEKAFTSAHGTALQSQSDLFSSPE